jgi:hypothetical protein
MYHQAAGAEALEAAEQHELGHRLRGARQRGARQEDHDRDLEELLAPVHVAELSVERRRGRGGQQVARDHPGEVVHAAQVADDRGQSGGHDRLVERGQQHAEHQRAEDRKQRASIWRG